MLNHIKKILSVLALASMVMFVVTVPVLLVLGKLVEWSAWVIGPFCVFLILGMGTLGLDWLMKKLAERQKADESEAGSEAEPEA